MNSIDSRMGHDYDIEEKMQRTLHFTSYMMYDKAYNHISNSIPGSMSQKYYSRFFDILKYLAEEPLNDHSITNTGENAYHCSLCDKSYTNIGSIKLE